MRRDFQQLDVFASTDLSGNPLAVVIDAEGLSTDEMQRFTRWMNLSETTFLTPPTVAGADYGVRIFTLDRELPFAGHPTIGSCQAWLDAGGVPASDEVIVQECGAGLVPIRRSGDGTLAFAAPPLIRSGPVDPPLLDRLLSVCDLGPSEVLDAAWVDNGPGWVALLLESADRILSVEADGSGFDRLELGIVGLYPEGAECAIEVRALFTGAHGAVLEDPVTGSLNASIAQWLLESGRLEAPYVASQGTCVGRRGRVMVTTGPVPGSDDETEAVWVGGRAVPRINGTVDL